MPDSSFPSTIEKRPEAFFAGFQVANPLHRALLPEFFERHYQRHVQAAKSEFVRFNDCHGPIKLTLVQIKHRHFSAACFGIQLDYQEGAEASWLDYVDDELTYDTYLLANKRDASGNLLKPDEEFRVLDEEEPLRLQSDTGFSLGLGR